MKLSIVQLERFVRSARQGTYSAAADDLYVCPQTVSKSVHDMEGALRMQLFETEGGRLKPTLGGIAVLRYAIEVLDSLEQIRLISDEGALPAPVGRGELNLAVACSPLRGSLYAERDFERFRHMYPQVDLSLSFCSGSACLSALRAGDVDAAIVAGSLEEEGIASARVRTWELSLLVSREHFIAARGYAVLDDLRLIPVAKPYDYRCCKAIVDGGLSGRGVEPRFTSLEMRVDRHRAFLEDEGGAMLVVADPQLKQLFPTAAIVPFSMCDRLALPGCFVRRKGCDTPWSKLMANYLRVLG